MDLKKLKTELIEQKKSKFKGNIYHFSQVNFVFNSNKIEGGHLTEDETEEIFETNSFISKADDAIKLDDLIEMKNHFRLFDYMLDIIEFHVRFERIHPFGDGNGRVGRIIMFKECLKNNILPFIVLDTDKPYYMRGLKEYKNDKMYLIDTIKNEQDIYEQVCNQLLDFEL